MLCVYLEEIYIHGEESIYSVVSKTQIDSRSNVPATAVLCTSYLIDARAISPWTITGDDHRRKDCIPQRTHP